VKAPAHGLASKLPDVGTTIFSVMSKLASDHNAINLSQGFPDFEPPKGLLDALQARLSQGGYHQYPPMHGIADLRCQIAEKVRRHYRVTVDPELDITVTSGATEALFVAMQAVVQPHDEVILFDPAYDAYDPAVRLAGGIPVHLALKAPHFTIDLALLRAAITPKTRLLVINSPHNPCGSLIDAETLKAIGQLATEFGLYVLSDEVYEHMVFDDARHISALEIPDLKDRSFVVSSFGKTYHATGWKVAYCIAPEALTREFRKVHQFVTFTTHTPSQWAIADFMAADQGHVENLSAFYQDKRDRFLRLFDGLGFRMRPSPGTYFQLADYSGVAALAHLPDTDCAVALTKNYGVAAIPVSVFYDAPPKSSRVLRFCFAKSDETLIEAARRLALGLGSTGTAP
jgi:methionine aminotransferase